MPTIEELNRDCPDHDRSSCSDENPVNAGVDLRYGSVWCRRCEGIWRMKEQNDARDAARYRWLRDGNDDKYSRATYVARNLFGFEWDSEIDREIAQAGGNP